MLTLGERIALWRVRRGLSKKMLAAEIGISPKQLSRYEADLIPPPTDVLRRLVVRLNISADYLIGLREEATRVKLDGKTSSLKTPLRRRRTDQPSAPIQSPILTLHG